MFAAILAIGLLLAINFSSRVTAGQPLQEAYNQVVEEIDLLKQEQSELIALRDYVQSDAYVEQWARDEGAMIREGDVLVYPVPAGGADIAPTQVPNQLSIPVETTPRKPDSWEVWWRLFFDSTPPEFN
ncbi:MAG: septum formation initiator family protein [Anaerolineae bacterium]|nr:septum formation initiator family protein [Anaerolineae bacterium]